MSPIRITWARTLGHAAGLYTTALSVAGFLALSAATFAVNFDRAEGGALALAPLWAVSVSPVLPVLAALLAMGVWSDERQSGRMALLLSVAVRERDYVLGKFLGVWTALVFAVLLSLASTAGALLALAPSAVTSAPPLSFLPPVLSLAAQALLWSAVSVACSAAFRHAAAAAATAVVLLVALPRAAWAGLRRWSALGAPAFGEMPLDALALDGAMGVFPLGAWAAVLALTGVALLVATKFVAASRLVGRGARTLRASTAVVLALALAFAALFAHVAGRFDAALEIPVSGLSSELSARTRGILADTSGEIDVTVFLSRDDARFRPLGHLLRTFRSASAALGGARLTLRFVDPRWDVAEAERLAARGVTEASLLFEKGRRSTVLALKDGFSDRLLAAAVRRLTPTTWRRSVYWTVGHGEASLGGYGLYGLSDIARELSREGFRNAPIDLTQAESLPNDCALVVVSGPRDGFARVELDRLDAYLKAGGRLLVLLGTAEGSGLSSLLGSWGLKADAAPRPAEAAPGDGTVSVSSFSDHPVTAPLRGSRLLMTRPAAFRPSAAVTSGTGADRISFAALASWDGAALAAAVERGAAAGDDLAIRPTRLIAVGDATFALNGSLAARGSANRDFILNCVAYLAGTDVPSAVGPDEAGALVSGLDHAGRIRLLAVTVAGVPAAVFLALAGFTLRRRLRT